MNASECKGKKSIKNEQQGTVIEVNLEARQDETKGKVVII